MNIRHLALGAVILAGLAAPAFAAPDPVPGNNATLSGSEGPKSNSTGYPSGADSAGTVSTTNTATTTGAVPPAR